MHVLCKMNNRQPTYPNAGVESSKQASCQAVYADACMLLVIAGSKFNNGYPPKQRSECRCARGRVANCISTGGYVLLPAGWRVLWLQRRQPRVCDDSFRTAWALHLATNAKHCKGSRRLASHKGQGANTVQPAC